MSRTSLLVLLLLVAGIGVGLSLQVLLQRPGGGTTVSTGTPPTPSLPTAVPQGHLYTGISEAPNDLNPFTTDSAVARTYVMGFTHDTLLDIDPTTGALRGSLAERWQVADDGMSMLVTLREGVLFSDGAPLTLDDVVFTYDVARSPDMLLGSNADGMSLVGGIDVVSAAERTLRIRFQRRYFAAAQVVGENWVVGQRRWFLARIAEQAARDGVPVPAPGEAGFGALLGKIVDAPGPGTGPYRFDGDDSARPSWRRGRDLTLFRSERSWHRTARPGTWNLGGIRLLFASDGAAKHVALMARDLDWYTAPDLQTLLAREPGLAADYRREVYDRPTLGLYLVQWNTENLRDPRVRRALSMLFDPDKIVRSLLGGEGRPAVAFGKPDLPGYPTDLAPIACDPPAARRLLREAGYAPEEGKPLRVRLLVPVEVDLYRQMAEFAADAARAAGVDLELQVVVIEELMRRRSGGDWDGALVQIGMPRFADPYERFHSQGSANAMHWRNAAADALLEQQRLELDPARRGALLEQFHRIVRDEQPVTLLAHPLVEVLISKRIENAKPGPRGLWPERFWVPTELQRAGP